MTSALINDRYRVVRPLGHGSDARVFLVEDRDRGGALRALKLVPRRAGEAGPDAGERLAGEFRRLAALDHACLVRVHDLDVVRASSAGLAAGTAFLTTDYAGGVDPVAAVARAREPGICLLAIAQDVASALAHIHAAGLLHCDVKPSNVAVTAGEGPDDPDDDVRAVLLDLGLSAAHEPAGRAGRLDARGTPAYMPAEAFAGTPDPRSDLYGLGATLYCAATGAPPYAAPSLPALIRAICDRDPAPAGDRAPWLPAPVAELIHRLLAREPADRPSGALVVLDEIGRIRERLGLAPRTPGAEPETGAAASSPARAGTPVLLPPRLVGRPDSLAALSRAFDDVGRLAAAGPAPVRVVGPAGAGRTALVREAIRRRQLAIAAGRAAPLAFLRGTASELEAFLAVRDPDGYDDDPARPDGDAVAGEPAGDLARSLELAGTVARRVARWVDRVLAAAVARAPAVLAVESSGDPREAALIRAARAQRGATRGLLVIVEAEQAEPANTVADAPERADRATGEGVAEVEGGGVVEVRVEPLSAAGVAEVVASMLGREPAAAWPAELAAVTGGLPRLVVEAVRAAAARAGPAAVERVRPGELLRGTGDALARAVACQLAALPREHAAVVEALAVHGGRAGADAIAAALGVAPADIHERASALAACGLVARAGDALRLPSAGHARAVIDALDSSRVVALHRAALAWRESRSAPDPVACARHLVACGPASGAIPACRRAAAALLAQGRGDEALAMIRHAADRLRASPPGDAPDEAFDDPGFVPRVLVEHAAIATATGHYDEAIASAEQAARIVAAPGVETTALRREALLALARARQKAGDLDAAEAVLADLVDLADRADTDDERASGAYARLLVARARCAEAARVAGEPETEPPAAGPLPPGRALRLEAAGLARLYLADWDGAERAFARLEDGARAARDRALGGRAASLRGMVAQARGDIAGAATLYRHAAASARAVSDVHAAAAADLNQAVAHAERGRFADALSALTTAVAELRRLGDVPELPYALFNRGLALLGLGEIAAARRSAREALALARALGTPQMQVYAHLLEGDVSRREGDPAAAARVYERALAVAERAGHTRDALIARLNLAEVLALCGDSACLAALAQAARDAHSEDDRARLALARARVVLAREPAETPAPPPASPPSALESFDDSSAFREFHGPAELADIREVALAVHHSAARNRSAGRIDQAWRCSVAAARLWARLGDAGLARADAATARELVDEIAADTPEAWRAGLLSDPDARALARILAPAPDAPASPERPEGLADAAISRNTGARSVADLRRLLALSRRLNSERRLEPLLSDILDTVIELTSAERGFLLLVPRPPAAAVTAVTPTAPDGQTAAELEIRVARNFDQTALAGDDLRLSRSIAEQAARQGDVVLTVDAAFDDRFEAAASVAALRLRSVLAVPLRQRGQVTGTIYVDHRFRRSAFDDASVELVRELADIAAVAIENARLVEDNRRRQAEIEALNRRLEAEVVEVEAALATARARLAPGRAGLRHAYGAIVGDSPAIVDMLQIVDRAAASALPVVITGESGTGKELVARALHEHGPRRDGPFVAVNCGAVPDSLLESELFGHARGAFTGADRARRGLFEVADGGTLLLDEIAETSAAMQIKLLRVLQEGELRRVGEERPRRVEVRVVAASNRDLAGLVAAGAFRQDLFYRLHVIQIRVPPLRERLEDIPALCAHILARLAAASPSASLTVSRGDPDPRPPSLTRGALARLLRHDWPGNVRELENQLARAFALGGQVIREEDLLLAPAASSASERRAAGDGAVGLEGDDGGEGLMLRPRVEALERRLIAAALAQTGGVQTRAARLLGLSRYGLQKKLARYGMSADRPARTRT